MDLFGLCPHCDLPIFVTETVSFCPYCQRSLPDDDSTFANDSVSNFILSVKDKVYFEWHEIQRLIHVAETMIAINTRISQELGLALIELEKARKRLEFYQKATTFRVK